MKKRILSWFLMLLILSVMSAGCVNAEDIPAVNVQQEPTEAAVTEEPEQTQQAPVQTPQQEKPEETQQPEIDFTAQDALERTTWEMKRITVDGQDMDIDAYLEIHSDATTQISFRDGMITMTMGKDGSMGSVLTNYEYADGTVSVIYPRASGEDARVDLPIEDGMIRIDLTNTQGESTGTTIYYGIAE